MENIQTRRQALAKRIRTALQFEADRVLDDPDLLEVYASDGLTAYREVPLVAVLPTSTNEIAELLAFCSQAGIAVVPRGAGTSLSGGALPLKEGVLLVLSRLNRILSVDIDNSTAKVQPGVTNLSISERVQSHGLFFAPDPSSQIVCSIGGNVAENAGGVHCLKYGLTTHNINAVTLVTAHGEILEIGGAEGEQEGFDLLAVVTGSEGMLGVIAEITVKLTQRPACVEVALIGFPSARTAGEFVARVLKAGLIPAGMEMMDKLAIDAACEFCQPGYPQDCENLLIVEIDGRPQEVSERVRQLHAIAKELDCSSFESSDDPVECARYWSGRKNAFPAVGRLGPDYYCMDGSIPRAKIADILTEIASLSKKYGLAVTNVFHAGDGNLHPLIIYDASIDEELEKAEAMGRDILRACVAVGGALTGEHGVGVEKKALLPEVMDDASIRTQQRLKCAFDPQGMLNPGKVFPVLHRCAELGAVHVHGGVLLHPEIPRF